MSQVRDLYRQRAAAATTVDGLQPVLIRAASERRRMCAKRPGSWWCAEMDRILDDLLDRLSVLLGEAEREAERAELAARRREARR